MITRFALFEGQIHKGRERDFRHFVETRLVPLWTQFPGAWDISVMFAVERDDGAPPIAMVLAIRYPNTDAVRLALESDVRFESRRVTAELLEMFDGRVHHHVFDTTRYEPAPHAQSIP